MAQVVNIISSATVGAATAKLLDITDGSVEYTAASATLTGGLWYACSFIGVTQGTYAFCLYDGGTERAGMLVTIDAASGVWGDLTLIPETSGAAGDAASTQSGTTVYIYQGDSYDGTARSKLTWSVTRDFRSGWTGTITVRHRVTAAVLMTATVSGLTATSIECSLSSTNTAFPLLVDDTEFGPHPYDVEFVSGSSKLTPVNGIMDITKQRTA